MKDTLFYNQESIQYSEKRYPRVAQSYTQFFFNRRLAIAKKYIACIFGKGDKQYTLLELGCADGIIVREFNRAFPARFAKLVGIDISPGMVEEARKRNTDPHIEFLLRDQYVNQPSVDIINETGVINYAGFDADIAFVTTNLVPGGWYVLSIAGISSLRNKLKGEGDFVDFRSYGEYEKILQVNFAIYASVGCGVFIPHIWKLPILARLMQPIAETVLGSLVPNWCHEKVYLLQKK